MKVMDRIKIILNIILAKRYILISFQILLFIALYLGVRGYTQRALVQDVPPMLNATFLSGESFNLQAPFHEPRLLHFWATWCPVCKLEQDSIESISKDYSVVSIAMQSGTDIELEQYMQDENLSFAVIADARGTIAHRFGVKAVPVSFILNDKGNIVFTETGFTSSWGLRFRLWLADFL